MKFYWYDIKKKTRKIVRDSEYARWSTLVSELEAPSFSMLTITITFKNDGKVKKCVNVGQFILPCSIRRRTCIHITNCGMMGLVR
jgi:hypothetical protein